VNDLLSRAKDPKGKNPRGALLFDKTPPRGVRAVSTPLVTRAHKILQAGRRESSQECAPKDAAKQTAHPARQRPEHPKWCAPTEKGQIKEEFKPQNHASKVPKV